MRFVLRSTVPPITRVLLIESGSRELAERFAPVLRVVCGGAVDVDLLTCQHDPSADSPIFARKVYHTQDFSNGSARSKLLKEFRDNDYQALVLLCADSPILNRWKWWVALQLPAKVLIANENADCFWLDMAHRRSAKGMLAARYGLQGAGSVKTLGELLLFPFVLGWLITFATFLHLRRGLRLLFQPSRAATAR